MSNLEATNESLNETLEEMYSFLIKSGIPESRFVVILLVSSLVDGN